MAQLRRHPQNHIIISSGRNRFDAAIQTGKLRFAVSWNNVRIRLNHGEFTMKFRLAALCMLMAIAGAIAFAHGDKKHISGIVDKITADSVFVKTADGKSVEVKLVASTVYVLHVVSTTAAPSDPNSDKPAKLSDLAVWDRVLIHATPKGETLEAAEVKFSAPGSAPASKPKS
jgi:hypothetical protein